MSRHFNSNTAHFMPVVVVEEPWRTHSCVPSQDSSRLRCRCFGEPKPIRVPPRCTRHPAPVTVRPTLPPCSIDLPQADGRDRSPGKRFPTLRVGPFVGRFRHEEVECIRLHRHHLAMDESAVRKREFDFNASNNRREFAPSQLELLARGMLGGFC